jgi:hypothetical protein
MAIWNTMYDTRVANDWYLLIHINQLRVNKKNGNVKDFKMGFKSKKKILNKFFSYRQ